MLVTTKEEDSAPPIASFQHPLVVVLTADCDLHQDFAARTPNAQFLAGDVVIDVEESEPRLVPYVLICDLYPLNVIRNRIAGSDIWKRVVRNQDERYHHLSSVPISAVPTDEVADHVMDFKKTLALPTASLYQGIHSGHVKRIAVVPPIYVHDLMHRFYGFLSRVGLPE